MSFLLAALSYRQLGPDSTAPTPSCDETRTTVGIIWSCLSMIILCTWTSVSPNVPSVLRSGHEALVYWDNAKIFFVALVGPELIVFWSIRQWFAAREMAKEYKKYGWTITHAFFASMGGFALYDSDGNFLFHLWDQQFSEHSKYGQDGYDAQLRKLKELHPHGHGEFESPLEYCVANGLIVMTEKEIESLGHTDLLAKTIAISQTLYFITSCIARGVKGLAITELEFLTLGFAALNLVTYSFWWHKPSRVRFPIRVMVRHGPLSSQQSSGPQDQDEEANSRLLGTETPAMSPEARAPGILSAFWDRIWDDYGDGQDWDDWSLRKRTMWILLLPPRAAGRTLDYSFFGEGAARPQPERGNIFSAGNHKASNDGLIFLLMLFAAVILGVFHCIPIMLNYRDFPGRTKDHHLWTIFALLTTVAPLGAPILLLVGYALQDLSADWAIELVAQLILGLAAILSLVYPVARIALMVLAAKQLTDLPPSALQQVEWTTLIPHFGI
ncbi:hypothetical protein AAF712_006760 [Marasmius tenuissimus]|uniref:Uncharacterized protein n=1 Tax=Marasmius tenuissimus TaxID=585030 RepID=A0ABR2ZYJ1_9AGAR